MADEDKDKWQMWTHSLNASWHSRPYSIYRTGSSKYSVFFLEEFAVTFESLEDAQQHVVDEIKRRYEAMRIARMPMPVRVVEVDPACPPPLESPE